jgi:hypothetical protein
MWKARAYPSLKPLGMCYCVIVLLSYVLLITSPYALSVLYVVCRMSFNHILLCHIPLSLLLSFNLILPHTYTHTHTHTNTHTHTHTHTHTSKVVTCLTSKRDWPSSRTGWSTNPPLCSGSVVSSSRRYVLIGVVCRICVYMQYNCV